MSLTFDDLVHVTLKNRDDFLKVKETLTRIGVASKTSNVLYQSCHILHKRGNYALVHFKELFALDGRNTTLDDEDIARRNTICGLLSDWGLLEVRDPSRIAEPKVPISRIKILSHKDKANWELRPKYTIGAWKTDK